jgi:chemotaxis protein MotB
MTMARRLVVGGVCGLAGLLLLTGCENPDRLQIESLQSKVNELQTENDDLRSRLAQAVSERDTARARAQALEQQVADLRRQLAAKPPAEGLKGWEYSGPYAWTTISTDFLFDSGKATLRPAAREKLQQVVQEIQAKFPDRMVWVLGHTDTDPIKVTKNLWEDNLDLSCNRGMTVYRELMKLGIKPERMIAGGQGEFYPRTSNSTKAGKQQNRRVEIITVPPREAPAVEPTGPEKTAEPAATGEPLIPK